MKIFLVLPFLLLTQALPVSAETNFPTASEAMGMLKEWKMQRTRTYPADSINNALADLEIDYGSYDTPKQEELLQLSCDGDNQGPRWRHDRCSHRSGLRSF